MSVLSAGRTRHSRSASTPPPLTPTVYDVVVTHARSEPLRNVFRYDARLWLVDLDRLPRLRGPLRGLARFEARDHVGDPSRSLRDNVAAVASSAGHDLAGGRILSLLNARGLGYVFNPISVHWCYDAAGVLVATVAEVHNTYGDRHAYVLQPDGSGRVDAEVGKAMYVSPFNAVDGHYRIVAPPPGEDLSLTVSLHREGQPPFVATLRGRRTRPRPLPVLALLTATASLRTTALIHWQGIRLALRGLRIEPRPVHRPDDSSVGGAAAPPTPGGRR